MRAMTTWHMTAASDGRQPLFPDENSRRSAVRVLARAAGSDMALFSIVDDHVHVVVLGAQARVGKIARSVVLGTSPIESAMKDASRRAETRRDAPLRAARC